MPAALLTTKLYIPPPPPRFVARPRLVQRLNAAHAAGRAPGVTLISASAGFGKTTVMSEWISAKDEEKRLTHPSSLILHPSQVAWLSLDADDNDPARFLAYLIAALQTIAPSIGQSVLGALQSPQPPPAESILTGLVNEIAALPDPFVLVLDDYHVIEAKAVDLALAFLVEHLPAQMHLVIATRQDPDLPLARLRARGQLTELRAADLRFTADEAAEFLNQAMGLRLSAADIAALEARTEGWIAGLHLAALAMQGPPSAPAQPDTTAFIQSFTGSHRFVLDYLVEEVLQQQPQPIQAFLLRTAILERLCGPLCDAVLLDAAAEGQKTLETIERANLFIVPLDNERRWYRYHHLFAELLRQRLQQRGAAEVAALHSRASQWLEDNGLEIEAFQHAAAANDLDRAERLMEGKGIPLHLRGAVVIILDWLATLPEAVLNARPALWWRYAALLLVNGQTTGVAEKLQAAEDALGNAALDDNARQLVGRIAVARATLALTRYDVPAMLIQSRRALEYLPADNLSRRANANWTLGYAYLFQGDRPAARQALTDAIAISRAARDVFTTILASIGLGNVQEGDNQLQQAAETYRNVLEMAGNQPLQIINEAHLGLARVLYEWNELAAAEQHGQQSLELARQYDRVIDRSVIGEVFLARLKLAQGELADAAALLDKTEQFTRQKNFLHRLPEVAAAQVLVRLRQGQTAAAAEMAQTHALLLSQARVHLAQGNAAAALTVLETYRRQVEAKGWADERLRTLVLQALAHQALAAQDQARALLGNALALAEPGGFIRLFVDEGPPMAQLLSLAAARGVMPDYTGQLLAVLAAETTPRGNQAPPHTAKGLIEPLSAREREVLQLMAQGLSNGEISERLFLALSTVKGHNRLIFDKLQVQSRTQAIARARELGLI